MLSVLMSVYKEPTEWIDEAINSILEQTFRNFEFLIINDNPNDRRLSDYLNEKSASDSRIRIITNPENFGLTKSLNIGLEFCKGEFIARMDADDWSYPYRFEHQLSYMEDHTDCIACSALAYAWDGSNSITPLYRPTSYQKIISYTFTSSPFIHPLLMLRRFVFTKYGLRYNQNFKRSQDYKLVIDLLKYGKIGNVNEYLLKYRISSQQISTQFGTEQVAFSKAIRREYIDWFYHKHSFSALPAGVHYSDIKENENMEKRYLQSQSFSREEKRNFKQSMNCIRRLLYYSLDKYSLRSLTRFVCSGDYLHYPYNLRRFMIILLKHIKATIIPKLL